MSPSLWIWHVFAAVCCVVIISEMVGLYYWAWLKDTVALQLGLQNKCDNFWGDSISHGAYPAYNDWGALPDKLIT